jgi:site-specific DNA-methyltransferase (adenine-specific)
MPEQLLGRIIRATSNEDQLVLDPFAGSGTTLVAAKKLGRRFVGFELSGQYAQQARVRIEAAHIGDKLTGPEEPLVSAPRTGTGRASRPTRRTRKSRGADGNSLFPMDDDGAAATG